MPDWNTLQRYIDASAKCEASMAMVKISIMMLMLSLFWAWAFSQQSMWINKLQSRIEALETQEEN